MDIQVELVADRPGVARAYFATCIMIGREDGQGKGTSFKNSKLLSTSDEKSKATTPSKPNSLPVNSKKSQMIESFNRDIVLFILHQESICMIQPRGLRSNQSILVNSRRPTLIIL